MQVRLSETSRQVNASHIKASTAAENNSLYSCEWSYLQLQDLSLIEFSINHLSLIDRNNITDVQEADESFTDGYGSIEAKNFALAEIYLNESAKDLQARRLDPNLPFVLFINGFNTLNQDGEVNGTWMYDAAKMFAIRGLQNRYNRIEPNIGANVLFLTWGIPHIFTENFLAVLPSYLKTLANYDAILNFVADTISRLIDFSENSRAEQGGWKSNEERLNYYSQFKFFGHSLGSHIITDAVNRVGKSKAKDLKFGKVTRLDPAMPCFMSLGNGVSKERLDNTTNEVVVLHSNAGLLGLNGERADVEIVLNGGTFQPGCSWYDFSCHHARSTDILGYLDDRCQMVAYKCSTYHHFKSGACETCDFDPRPIDARHSDTYGDNCVLVNMPEQHKDTRKVINFVEEMEEENMRQLADENEQTDLVGIIQSYLSSSLRSPSSMLISSTDQLGSVAHLKQNRKRTYYHFVNTNSNFRSGRKTHCLQHYQARMMIVPSVSPDDEQLDKCPISSFFTVGRNEIDLKLIHDDSLLNQQAGGIGWNRKNEQAFGAYKLMGKRKKRQVISDQVLRSSPTIKLGRIIKDSLYTGLVNFEGSPELFIGAEISNIDAHGLSGCLQKNNISSVDLVLDMAFMSHTNRK